MAAGFNTILLTVGNVGDQYLVGIMDGPVPRVAVVGINTARPLPNSLKGVIRQFVKERVSYQGEIEVIDNNSAIRSLPSVSFWRDDATTPRVDYLTVSQAAEKLGTLLNVRTRYSSAETIPSLSISSKQMAYDEVKSAFNLAFSSVKLGEATKPPSLVDKANQSHLKQGFRAWIKSLSKN